MTVYIIRYGITKQERIENVFKIVKDETVLYVSSRKDGFVEVKRIYNAVSVECR